MYAFKFNNRNYNSQLALFNAFGAVKAETCKCEWSCIALAEYYRYCVLDYLNHNKDYYNYHKDEFGKLVAQCYIDWIKIKSVKIL